MRLKVIALASGHFWRRTDDGHSTYVSRLRGVQLRFFCGQYVLAVCTDETSAFIRKDVVHGYLELAFSAPKLRLFSSSTRIQCSRPPERIFIRSGFVELSVNNSSF